VCRCAHLTSAVAPHRLFTESLRRGHAPLIARHDTARVTLSALEIWLLVAGVVLAAGLVALVRR
jgi:ABC-type cobalamin transport system ATPase subunit